MQISVNHIDTACILLEINGSRILNDPTLDNAGKINHHGFSAISLKTENPVYLQNGLMNINLVLLSHHQHKDNFDHKGKEFALTVSKIISTKQAIAALKGVTGLDNREVCRIDTDKCSNLKIIAVPSQHHPWLLPVFCG